jgi:hypothetical protein
MDVVIMGVDLAKNVFQLHGVSRSGKLVVRRRVSRERLMDHSARLSQRARLPDAGRRRPALMHKPALQHEHAVRIPAIVIGAIGRS